MFKKIVKLISEGADINEVCGMIDNAYQNEKLSWAEHEMLYALIGRVKE